MQDEPTDEVDYQAEYDAPLDDDELRGVSRLPSLPSPMGWVDEAMSGHRARKGLTHEELRALEPVDNHQHRRARRRDATLRNGTFFFLAMFAVLQALLEMC